MVVGLLPAEHTGENAPLGAVHLIVAQVQLVKGLAPTSIPKQELFKFFVGILHLSGVAVDRFVIVNILGRELQCAGAHKVVVHGVPVCDLRVHLSLLLQVLGKADVHGVLQPHAVHILQPPGRGVHIAGHIDPQGLVVLGSALPQAGEQVDPPLPHFRNKIHIVLAAGNVVMLWVGAGL